MAFLNRRSDFSGLIAAALVVAMLTGAAPMFSGVNITVNEGAPALTLDLCHPLPGVSLGSGFSAAPLIAGPCIQTPVLLGTVTEFDTSPVIRRNAAPDPPPPKPLG